MNLSKLMHAGSSGSTLVGAPPNQVIVGMSLFLVMLLLPIKMYLRWAFNLKYLVHIQELFLNV